MKFSKNILLALAAASFTTAFVPSNHKAGRSLSFITSTRSAVGTSIIDRVVETIDEDDRADISEIEVRNFFHDWNDALKSGDAEAVAKLYADDGILGSVSDGQRTDFEGIKDYFDNFLKLEPQGVILDGRVKIGPNWAEDAGIYEFTMGKDGTKVKARYSFVYTYEDGEWKILHHQSSAMQEEMIAKIPESDTSYKQDISEEEVKDLFHLWNDALATLDSAAVARRYSKNAVLQATVSDTPRTDFDSIKDYFDNFLELKPQGEILDSYTVVGDSWCKDVGIYEFTSGADGSKIKARYSFIYVYEDGQWKISHHQSSVMPEFNSPKSVELTKPEAAKITEAEVKDLFLLWNNALATLDADAVARRYSKRPVLLPTVSDGPLTDYDSIKDYFAKFFLPRKPQVEIIESHAECGEDWCRDVGVYEFTMGVDGSKVRGRYSFIYVFEDGEWKISHHHSSAMPEELLSAIERLKAVESLLDMN